MIFFRQHFEQLPIRQRLHQHCSTGIWLEHVHHYSFGNFCLSRGKPKKGVGGIRLLTILYYRFWRLFFGHQKHSILKDTFYWLPSSPWWPCPFLSSLATSVSCWNSQAPLLQLPWRMSYRPSATWNSPMAPYGTGVRFLIGPALSLAWSSWS
jgi:hypothetical protein